MRKNTKINYYINIESKTIANKGKNTKLARITAIGIKQIYLRLAKTKTKNIDNYKLCDEINKILDLREWLFEPLYIV